MSERENNLVELIDENDQKIIFRHIMTLDYKNNEYIVLSPIDNNSFDDRVSKENEIIILRIEQDDDGYDFYVNINNENELNAVFSAVEEIYVKGFE